MTKVAILGASIGGLIAAAELSERGFSVTIIERGKSVGGLYGKVRTPFGLQELGMHVLYLSEAHFRHLCSIFGPGTFDVWRGYAVDIGASRNFGRNFFNSIYPDVRQLTTAPRILEQILNGGGNEGNPVDALNEVIGRFGEEAGRNIVAPILKKLWKLEPELLSKNAVHCFFDLRRVIACDKEQADKLKMDPRLDAVIGNPQQSMPSGEVFGGRMAVRFKNSDQTLGEVVEEWLARTNIEIRFNSNAKIAGDRLLLDDKPLDELFQGCIVATPVASLAPNLASVLDQLDLSIYYFKLSSTIGDKFPAYYILCHEAGLVSARIVNYSAYNFDNALGESNVIAVEVLHPIAMPPSEDLIANEVAKVFPSALISASYKLPNALRIHCPSLKNAELLDRATEGIDLRYSNSSLFFSGMRTDKGIFFSHHTIGQGYDAALECARRLS